MRVLFICTGNTCRSPKAEGYLKNLATKAGRMDIQVLSAGIGAFPGQTASAHGIEILGEEGIDLKDHQSRIAEKVFLEASDLILTMGRSHKSQLISAFPELKDKIFTLHEYAGEEGEVSDPFGGSRSEYEKTAKEIRNLVGKVWEKVADLQEN